MDCKPRPALVYSLLIVIEHTLGDALIVPSNRRNISTGAIPQGKEFSREPNH